MLLLALLREDGAFQVIGSTGNLGTDVDRKDLLAKVQGSVVASDYRAVASSGEMYQFVTPSLVLEISCTDLQSEDGEGKPVRQWALSHGTDGWHRVGPVAGASMLHPVLARVRTDKTVARPDVRVEQLSERVPVGDLSRKTPLEREVRIAPTRDEAEKIAEGMLASEIGKGWVRA